MNYEVISHYFRQQINSIVWLQKEEELYNNIYIKDNYNYILQ